MSELSNASAAPTKNIEGWPQWSPNDGHMNNVRLPKGGHTAATCLSPHDNNPEKHSASVCVSSPSHVSVTSLSPPTIPPISDNRLATPTGPMDYPDHLLCSICLDLLFKPISLIPCCHVFCERCLRRLFETSDSDTLCPLCREDIEACLPAEERALEVLKKYPAQVAEQQKSEQSIAQPPLLLFQNCSDIDSPEPDCDQPTIYIDYSSRWRSALWIFWVVAIGFLMVFSLNSFLNQAMYGSSPHHLPSHPHLSQNNDGPSFIVMLDVGKNRGENKGFTSLTSVTSTEDHFRYSSDYGKVKSDNARNHTVADDLRKRSAGYLFPSRVMKLFVAEMKVAPLAAD